MDQTEFLKQTILKLDDSLFEELKIILVREKYVSFSFFSREDVTKEVLAEKILDNFQEIEQGSKGFEKIAKKYISCLNSVVEDRIEKAPKKNKKDAVAPKPPRARKYYDYAERLKENLEFQSIIDYSRIMMCLYTEIIKTEYKDIEDFDYSFECIDLKEIVESMINEKKTLGKIKTPRFNLNNLSDRMSFMLLIVIYYYKKNNEVVGEF